MSDSHTRTTLSQARQAIKENGIWPGIGNALVVQEALDRGLHIRGTPQGRAVISRGSGRKLFWRNGVSNINSPLARRVVPQKEVTSRILRSAGVLAGENCVFHPSDGDRAWAWAQFGLPVVVKPFNASQGRGVHIGIVSRGEFEKAFSVVAANYGDVLVEEFLTGTEHRFLVVDNVVVAATRRVPANVEGDGKASIGTLVERKNRQRGLIHKPLRVDATVKLNLEKQGFNLDSVPAEGDLVYLRMTSNLHTGGDAVDATDAIPDTEKRFVESAAKALPGLRVAGFDVLLPRAHQDGPPTVLEINPFPMISMHHFPSEGTSRNVAGAIIGAMFPDK